MSVGVSRGAFSRLVGSRQHICGVSKSCVGLLACVLQAAQSRERGGPRAVAPKMLCCSYMVDFGCIDIMSLC